MPTVPPGRASARDRHGENTPELGFSWCLPCYESGAFTLAASPASTQCVAHGRGAVPERPNDPSRISSDEVRVTVHAWRSQSRPSQGPAWCEPAATSRPEPGRLVARSQTRERGPEAPNAAAARPGPAGPGRGREGRRARRALARAVGRASARAYGRERARRRLSSGRWDPHPGWRNRVEPDLVILTDQVTALARVEQLTGTELWRADKKDRWTRMLHRLVHSMDWTTGLVCGVTAAQLATAGSCAPRTVSRLIAWAQDAGLLVVVEAGASGAFLGTDRNRAPAYVFAAPPAPLAQEPATPGGQPGNHSVVTESAQLSTPVEENGDLPHSC
ncbi:MAG: hypothetical protein ACRDQ9_16820, partial [Pseudonocardiaceae bacterium]